MGFQFCKKILIEESAEIKLSFIIRQAKMCWRCSQYSTFQIIYASVYRTDIKNVTWNLEKKTSQDLVIPTGVALTVYAVAD